MENGLPEPNSIRPSNVSPELLCDVCHAIINEAIKGLGKKTSEVDVLYYLDNVCDPEKYYIYHFPPPEMKTGCDVFVGSYFDEIPKVLIKRKLDTKVEDIIDNLCNKTTKVCEGVDFNNIKRMDDEIQIDGEPIKINTNEEVTIGESKNNDNNKKTDL